MYIIYTGMHIQGSNVSIPCGTDFKFSAKKNLA